MIRKRIIRAVMLVAAVSTGAALFAQDIFGRRQSSSSGAYGNVEDDSKLTFVRIRYRTGFGGFGRRGSRGEPPWAHDYPTADTHLMKILNELTIASPRSDVSNVLTLDDPELFNYPIAYMSEPGFWVPSDEDVVALRTYLLKGGFIIFDDFRTREGHWDNLLEQMRRVLPEARWVEIDASHPIFHSFFDIQDLNYLTSYGGVQPTYWAIYENNDQSKRILAIADKDGDIGEYWEFSDTGFVPIDLSNEAYKFGVNYFIYALTH